MSELIDNLDFRPKNHHFTLVHRALVFPGSDIILRAVLAKTALRVTLKVGPASGKHLGSKKRPKTAGDRFPEEFWQISDFHENRQFFMLTRNTCPSRVLRLRRSQRDAAWHEPIYCISRSFLQKLVENELSELIDNLKNVANFIKKT